MANVRLAPIKFIILGVLLVLVVGGGITVLAFPGVLDAIKGNESGLSAELAHEREPAKLFKTATGNYGLRLSAEVIEGFSIRPVKVVEAKQPRPLPPQIGSVNFDNDRLFILPSRFPGEVAEIHQTRDLDQYPPIPSKFRPLRYGDRVNEGQLLAVVWSKDLGEKKAAMVDAMSSLRLSEDLLRRNAKLFEKGALPEAAYRASERQVQADRIALLTAERTLKMWKLSAAEIKAIKDEAQEIIKLTLDPAKKRDLDAEVKKWARVEIKAPIFTTERNRELYVVEKNVNLVQMVDPTTVMFKLADLSRQQIWVHPPEEYLPMLQERLKSGGKLTWEIRFQADPAAPPLKLPILQLAKSLDPNLHTPMLIGYLPNKEDRYLVGQFVTATIYVEPDPDTVEIPTDALNEVEGEALVFVQNGDRKDEFILKRVAVAQRFKDKTYVRARLTKKDLETSRAEVERGKRPLEPLLPGEQVITHGVVELTEELGDLVTKERIESGTDK
jgi:cobalt-zinc-cadmium efflux system membrane fusion protein